MMRLFWCALALWLGGATGAAAAPVVGAISAAVSAIGASAIGSFVLRIALSLALGRLSQMLRGKPKAKRPRTEVAVYGDLAHEEIILGRRATRGAYAHPVYVNGAYAHLVVSLCALPGASLRRVAVQGEWVDLDTANPHSDFGWPAVTGSKYAGALWVKYYDGTQTATDPYMLTTFATDDVAPWADDMIGEGICYAIVTMKKGNTPEVWAGLPQPVFELDGVPLYDPRKDDTAGGTGAHRWDDPATWEQTGNPAVMAYNLLRGIRLPGGDIFGGRAEAEDLAYGVWASAMDVCDEAVDDGAGGTKPRYTAGLSLTMDTDPATALEALVEAMAGALTALPDGRYVVRAGGPGLAVGGVDDEQDALASDVAVSRPHLPASERWIGVAATIPDPDSLWQAKAREAIISSELLDVGGRKVADVQMEAVWDGEQADRIAASWLADHELQRRHTIALGPAFGWVEPLDVLTLTSERFGYAGKTFEVVSVAEDPMIGKITATMKEVNSGGWE